MNRLHRRRLAFAAALCAQALLGLSSSSSVAAPGGGGRVSQPAPTNASGQVGAPAAAPASGASAAAVPPEAMDTTVDGASALPLDAILNHAMSHAVEVAVGRARVQRGDAAIEGAKPLLPDNLEVQFGLGARMNNTMGAAGGATFEMQMQALQPIEIAGERRRRIAAGRKVRELLEKDYERVRWETYTAVHVAFNRARVAKARADMVTRLVRFSESLLDVTRRRAQAGEISELRVRVAEGELARARQSKLAADLEYRLACLQLTRASGYPIDALVAPAGSLQPPRRVQNVQGLIANAAQNHPAVAARSAAVAEAQARKEAADRDGWPHPYVGFYVASESNGITGSGLRDTVGLGMIGVPLPFWRRNQGARAEARADVRIAQAERQALQYTLAQRIRLSAEALNTAAERVNSYAREVVPKFEANMDLLERAYSLGETSLVEVLVAQERFLKIQSEAINAYHSYFEAVYDLESAVGAPFDGFAVELAPASRPAAASAPAPGAPAPAR